MVTTGQKTTKISNEKSKNSIKRDHGHLGRSKDRVTSSISLDKPRSSSKQEISKKVRSQKP